MPLASLSLDLDNQWSYMKTHGDPGWDSFPTYLDTVIPRYLGLMSDLEVSTTVFIVGQDAALEKNHAALSQIPAAGHEVGNHSFHHEPWLHLYTDEEVLQEICNAEEAIEKATGRRPRGWRGPGFSFSPTVLRTLAERGYLYDASTFPTYLGPLARAYYFMRSGLKREEKANRKQLFGKWTEGRRSLHPYRWQFGPHRLLEIPVTTMPLFKSPFHLSYLLYLATFSTALAETYLKTALALCRATGIEPSYLLHPLDFLGCDDCPDLAFFPAMNRPGSWKMAQSRKFLGLLSDRFELVSMETHAQSILRAQGRTPEAALRVVTA